MVFGVERKNCLTFEDVFQEKLKSIMYVSVDLEELEWRKKSKLRKVKKVSYMC
jgi:hypothetical protein